MNQLWMHLHNHLNSSTESEKEVIKYLLANPDEIVFLNIRELAAKTYTSPSAIVRLCQSLGLKGYKEFKNIWISEFGFQKSGMALSEQDEVKQGDSLENIVNKLISNNVESLRKTAKSLDMSILESCVNLLERSKKVILFGMGSSFLVAEDLFLKLVRFNKDCHISADWHVQLLMARNIEKDDLAIMFSFSGMTKEMIKCAKMIKLSGANLVVVTGNEKSVLYKIADFPILVKSDEYTYRSGAMSSRIAQLCIVDILFTAFINKNYEKMLNQMKKTYIEKDEQEE